MGCLEKRAKVVVCKPDDSEVEGGRSTSAASEAAFSTTASSSTPNDVSDCWIPMSGGGVHPTCVPTINSTGSVAATYAGAASSIDIGAVGSSRAGVAIMVVVSLGSIAGMLL